MTDELYSTSETTSGAPPPGASGARAGRATREDSAKRRAPEPMTPRPFRVSKNEPETSDTFTLTLEPEDGRECSFSPGQFNMLYVFGKGESAISISGNPELTGGYVHTVRALGVVTRGLRALTPGDWVGVRGPFGRGWPIERAEGRDLVIVAGGVGMAPLRPVLLHVAAHRRRFRQVVLMFGVRTPDDLLFHDALGVLRDAGVDVQVTVDRTYEGWAGAVGVVTRLIPRAGFAPREVIAMICGPELMARFSALELRKRGVPRENVYVSLERNMKCAVGFCGHCQYGSSFVCKDGPVFTLDAIRPLLGRQEF